jgi:two-component system OmpR family response regulator
LNSALSSSEPWSDAFPSIGRVGILEDDRIVKELLARFVRASQGHPLLLANGVQAATAVKENLVDMLLVDLGLPREDGTEVIRRIRSFSTIPILVVSGRIEMPSVAAGLDAGADDYVRKPVSFEELGARMRSVLRRVRGDSRPAISPSRFRLGRTVIDLVEQVAEGAGVLEKLTEREALVLSHLLRSPGKLVTRDELCRALTGKAWDPATRSLDVHISNVRAKLRRAGCEGTVIKTCRPFGYRLAVSVEEMTR